MTRIYNTNVERDDIQGSSQLQIQYAPIPRFPPHPVHPTRHCDNCHHWLKSEAKRSAQIQGGGMVAISELVKAGVKLPPADCEANISYCTRLPMWAQTTDDHWCGQWIDPEIAQSIDLVRARHTDGCATKTDPTAQCDCYFR